MTTHIDRAKARRELSTLRGVYKKHGSYIEQLQEDVADAKRSRKRRQEIRDIEILIEGQERSRAMVETKILDIEALVFGDMMPKQPPTVARSQELLDRRDR